MSDRCVRAWLGVACVTLAAVLVSGGCIGCAAPDANGLSPSSPATAGGLVVKVIDASRAPLAGAVVSGRYPVNPGITPSTCCVMKPIGRATTGSDGVAVLSQPPFTDRMIELTLAYKDWPAQTMTLAGDRPEIRSRGTMSVVLGPDRVAPAISLRAAPPAPPSPPP